MMRLRKFKMKAKNPKAKPSKSPTTKVTKSKSSPIAFPAKSASPPLYTVIRDTREQKGWIFEANAYCEGTVIETMKTGDYTLRGLEDRFVVERKRNVAEFAQNILQA